MSEEIDVRDFDIVKPAEAKNGEVFVEDGLVLSREEKQAINLVKELVDIGRMPRKEAFALLRCLARFDQNAQMEEEGDVDYDEAFDLSKEIGEVLKSVRLLRKSILSPSGKSLRSGVTVGEAKDVISMSNSMINTLVKTHEKVVNMERYRAVEQATVDILRELDTDRVFARELNEYVESEERTQDGPLIRRFIDALSARLEG